MYNTFHELKRKLVAEMLTPCGSRDAARELEMAILGSWENRSLVAQHALERRSIRSVADFDPLYRPGILRVIPIRKPGKKVRITYSPEDCDFVHSLYLNFGIIGTLSEAILSDDAHAYRPHRGIETAINQLLAIVARQQGGPTAVYQDDIESCFDNVPVNNILHLLPPHTERQVRMLQTRFRETTSTRASHPRGLPQGHPASCPLVNMCLNLILQPVRGRYRGQAILLNYSDDLALAGPEEVVKSMRDDTEEVLNANGLHLHPGKRRQTIIDTGERITFLGYELDWNNGKGMPNIRPKRQAYQNLEDKLAVAGSLPQIRAIKNGWISHYRMTNDPAHRSRTDAAIQAGLTRQQTRHPNF